MKKGVVQIDICSKKEKNGAKGEKRKKKNGCGTFSHLIGVTRTTNNYVIINTITALKINSKSLDNHNIIIKKKSTSRLSRKIKNSKNL